MRLNQKVMLFLVALPFCAALIGCGATTEQSASKVVQSATRLGPVVKAPIYKNGDWWNVKIERKFVYTGDDCSWWYSKYLVKIDKSKPKVYGVSGSTEEEIECPEVEAQVLDSGPNAKVRLKFPLRVGDTWNHKFFREGYFRGRWSTVEYKVLGWEKVHTTKGVFEAFKLSSSYRWIREGDHREEIETYYYSPKVKAIILRKYIHLHSERLLYEITNTVADFNVNN